MTERITHAFNLLGLIFSKLGVHSRERFLLGSSVSTINTSVGSSNQCKGCPVRALLGLRDETLTPQFNSIWRRAFECMLCRLIHEAMPTHISWKYCLESPLQHFWSSFHPMHPVRHWFQLSAWAEHLNGMQGFWFQPAQALNATGFWWVIQQMVVELSISARE